MFNDLRPLLAQRRTTLEIKPAVRQFTAGQRFDPVYGACLVRRLIAREVETRISRAVLARDAQDRARIRVGYARADLTMSYQNPVSEAA